MRFYWRFDAPLGADETYTTNWFTDSFDDLAVSVESDADGDFYIDFSDDSGTTVSNTQPNNHWAINANLYGNHTAHPRGRDFRFRIVNGSSAQTYLRLIVRSGQVLAPKEIGADQRICYNTDSILSRVSDNPLDIIRDLYVNKKLEHVPAYNGDVDGAEDVWFTGGLFTFADSAETIQAVSTSDDDDKDSSVGVKNITIYGLDENYELTEETVDLEGTTPVTSTGTFVHVYKTVCRRVGSNGTNVGTITVQQSSSGIAFSTIGVGIGQSFSSAYVIPVTHQGVIVRFGGSLLDNNANTADLALWTQAFNVEYGEHECEKIVHRQAISTGGYNDIDFFGGHLVEPKTRIKLHVQDITNSNAQVSADYDLFLAWDCIYES